MLLDLLKSIGVWLIYFSLIFFPLRWAYDRLLGPRPPERPGDVRKAWEARQARLRRRFVAAGIGLAFLPLLVRLMVALSGA
jgi:hypothetical protein